MPLSKGASHSLPDRLTSEVLGLADTTSDEFVYESILEAGKQLRGQVVF